jgi:hypothetical protein
LFYKCKQYSRQSWIYMRLFAIRERKVTRIEMAGERNVCVSARIVHRCTRMQIEGYAGRREVLVLVKEQMIVAAKTKTTQLGNLQRHPLIFFSGPSQCTSSQHLHQHLHQHPSYAGDAVARQACHSRPSQALGPRCRSDQCSSRHHAFALWCRC